VKREAAVHDVELRRDPAGEWRRLDVGAMDGRRETSSGGERSGRRPEHLRSMPRSTDPTDLALRQCSGMSHEAELSVLGHCLGRSRRRAWAARHCHNASARHRRITLRTRDLLSILAAEQSTDERDYPLAV
jgi:hypothetical protein